MDHQLNLPLTSEHTLDTTRLINSLEKVVLSNKQVDLEAAGRFVVFTCRGREPLMPEFRGLRLEGLEARRLEPCRREVFVVGVDSSCIKVGETDEGSVYAARVSYTLSRAGRVLSYFRLGPLIIYLSEENASRLLDTQLARLVVLEELWAERMIRVRLERTLQLELARSLRGSLILVDGSLRSSVFEAEGAGLHDVAREAEDRGNLLLGVSKTSRLKVLQRLSAHLSSLSYAPAYMDLDRLLKPVLPKTFGKIMLVKFAYGGVGLRVDVHTPEGIRPEEALALLVGNESFPKGYPETLRLSHHLSSITKVDELCVKSYLARRLQPHASYCDVRGVLLGPYELGAYGVKV